jgi:hypothetical protein
MLDSWQGIHCDGDSIDSAAGWELEAGILFQGITQVSIRAANLTAISFDVLEFVR